jgi:hypothetical protein
LAPNEGRLQVAGPSDTLPEPSLFESVRARTHWCRQEVLDPTMELAIEIAREGPGVASQCG